MSSSVYLLLTRNFGDGTTETTTGLGTRHAYTSAGTFTASATVTVGNQSGTDRHTLTIRALTGTWDGSSAAGPFVAIMTQNGTTVSGTIGEGTLTGNLDKSGNIGFRLECLRGGGTTFNGLAETANRITGSGFLPCSAFNQGATVYTMTRRQ